MWKVRKPGQERGRLRSSFAMTPVKESWLRRGLVVLTIALAVLCSSCNAARPGGLVGVTLTPSHSVVTEDGSTVEEYEVCDVITCARVPLTSMV